MHNQVFSICCTNIHSKWSYACTPYTVNVFKTRTTWPGCSSVSPVPTIHCQLQLHTVFGVQRVIYQIHTIYRISCLLRHIFFSPLTNVPKITLHFTLEDQRLQSSKIPCTSYQLQHLMRWEICCVVVGVGKSTGSTPSIQSIVLKVYPKDGGCCFLRNTDTDLPNYTALHLWGQWMFMVIAMRTSNLTQHKLP